MNTTFIFGVLCGLGVAAIQGVGLFLAMRMNHRRKLRATFPLHRTVTR